MVILLAQVCGPKWEGCHKERLWGLQTLFGPRSPAFSPSVPGLYRSSLEAPEAFQAEYEASSNRVLSILQSLLLDDANALHYAAGCGCLDLCEALLRQHPQLNFQEDQYGHTPLLWAVRHGMAGAMQLLLRHGALAWHSDQRGLTALHWCCALDLPRLCRLLLAVPLYVETMIDQRCRRGWTPLHSGAYSGAASCCEQLVAANAQLALRTPDEWTALHLAALKGHAEVLNILAPHCSTEAHVDGGGSPSIRSKRDGQHSPLVRCAVNARSDIRQLLP
ncbi:Ankyrin repeat [Durusdinium trenchii]|uniref:PH and SEC7 domain containing protein secG n=1 Tax=Durusdinium trenchii TaxID=1381693 RepID=A0ABP0KWL9_9DINO